jgi:hypothetical protein
LTRRIPEAADDEGFNSALASCAAAWLATILSNLPRVVDADLKYGRSTWRQRIVVGLEHFVVIAEDTGRIPALADTAAKARALLLAAWGEDANAMPVCNAFALAGDNVWERERR